MDRPRCTLFGVPLELGQPAQMLRTILAWKPEGSPRQVMYLNAQLVNQSRELPELAQALSNADLVYCEGSGVRLAARALGLPLPPRITGTDWVWGLASLCQSSARSLYLLGSEPQVAREAADTLARWYPTLSIVGAHHGYADLESPQNQRLVEDINAKQPDILLVGMGSPKQELWAHRYASLLDVDVVWTVGGLLDHVARPVSRSPRVLVGKALKSMLRLATQPRRMWRRYVIAGPVLLTREVVEARRRR